MLIVFNLISWITAKLCDITIAPIFLYPVLCCSKRNFYKNKTTTAESSDSKNNNY